jgi:hypothetical protein
MPDIRPIDIDTERPLPRRLAPQPRPPRANRPKFGLFDSVWIALLLVLTIGVSYRTFGFGPNTAGGLLSAAGTVASLYLLGWKARDRAAGLGAGLLAATSPPFLHLCATSPQSALFMLLTISALFAFVAGSSLAALALAAGATFVRPDGLLLGLLLAGLSIVQHRKRSIYGAALYLAAVPAIWAAQIALGHKSLVLPGFGFHAEAIHVLAAPASLLLLWFLLPLFAEISEPMRRARWAPVMLWALLTLGIDLVYAPVSPAAMALPLTAVLYGLGGGGLSRLLPTLTGEIPRPFLRYALAALAVLTLAGLHWRLE